MPTPKNKGKPQVSIVGSGRLGSALAIALFKERYTINALVARGRASAQKTATLLDAPSLVLAAKQLPKLPPTDLIIIATPDDQISQVVDALLKVSIDWRRKTTVLHTSGALSSKTLSPLVGKGWAIGSIHPMIAVSDPVSGARSLSGVFWCVEGDKKAVNLARRIVRDLEGHSFSVSTKRKPLYHAAAVMASGNMVALFDIALEMLSHCGLSTSKAQQILLPLVETTVGNLAESDPAQALTGPFARGDLETVQQHLDALAGSRLESVRDLYRLLGLRALKLAEKNGVERRTLKRIAKTLEK